MAFHCLKFVQQAIKHWIAPERPHSASAALEDARGIITTRSHAGMTDVRVNRYLRILRIAAMRTVPLFINPSGGQDGKTLSPPARSPERQCLMFQELLGPAPWFALDLTPVLEIAGQKGAERARLRRTEGFVEAAKPDLLSF